MKAARYRFQLGTPLATSANQTYRPLLFDGILGYAWAVQQGLFKNPGEERIERLQFPDLPVAQIVDRCYAASAAFLPGEAYLEPSMLIRHADWKNAVNRHRIGNIVYQVSSGWTQAVQEIYWLTVTPHLDFYVRGEMGAINNLLNIIWDIRHLGSKRGSGYGLITDIRIDEAAEDFAVWREGEPTRPIPVTAAGEREDLIREWTTYYPPYWQGANAAWCYVPPVRQYLPQTALESGDTVTEYCRNVLTDYQAMTARIEKGRRDQDRKTQSKRSRGGSG